MRFRFRQRNPFLASLGPGMASWSSSCSDPSVQPAALIEGVVDPWHWPVWERKVMDMSRRPTQSGDTILCPGWWLLYQYDKHIWDKEGGAEILLSPERQQRRQAIGHNGLRNAFDSVRWRRAHVNKAQELQATLARCQRSQCQAAVPAACPARVESPSVEGLLRWCFPLAQDVLLTVTASLQRSISPQRPFQGLSHGSLLICITCV